jgi:DNA-binding NarL/FixJ family response regulator
MINILIADDHAIVRKGLRQILLEQYPFANIAEAGDVEALIAEVIKQDWDVVVCDMNMPGRSGLATNQANSTEATGSNYEYVPRRSICLKST